MKSYNQSFTITGLQSYTQKHANINEQTIISNQNDDLKSLINKQKLQIVHQNKKIFSLQQQLDNIQQGDFSTLKQQNIQLFKRVLDLEEQLKSDKIQFELMNDFKSHFTTDLSNSDEIYQNQIAQLRKENAELKLKIPTNDQQTAANQLLINKNIALSEQVKECYKLMKSQKINPSTSESPDLHDLQSQLAKQKEEIHILLSEKVAYETSKQACQNCEQLMQKIQKLENKK